MMTLIVDKLDAISKEAILQYYDIMDKNPLVTNSVFEAVKGMRRGDYDMIISDRRIIRFLGRVKRLERTSIKHATDIAIEYMAFKDMLLLLSRKGVPVYFYNRVGEKKEDYIYSNSENKRMEQGLSFPVMYNHIQEYESDLREIFGDLYTVDYIKEIGKIPQVIKVGDYYQHEDISAKYINITNGKRKTCYQPRSASHTIHVYGRCGVFGYAVEDKDTIPSLIQKGLVERGMNDFKVENNGLWGGTNSFIDHNFLRDAIGYTKGDIVVFYRMHFAMPLIKKLERCGLKYLDITDKWHILKDEKTTFFDRPGHMNAEGYRLVAKIICEDLIANCFTCGNVTTKSSDASTFFLNYYLKSQREDNLDKEVREYIGNVIRDYPMNNCSHNGAIVMNCNPFTKGHRFLIETAAKQVDRLYVFVVEEDKSYFLFKDRYEMVKRGSSDIENVVVIPSGKFIISAYTFPEYFMKDYVKEKEFDVSSDVTIFCKYIAPRLRIETRFAGEEPFDPVTRNYNDSMEEILPKYGLRFSEIPRARVKDTGEVINATRVRELIEERDEISLKRFLPESTIRIIKEKYM